MRRAPLILGAGPAGASAAIVLALYPSEPFYDGKALSDWIIQMRQGREPEKARAVFRRLRELKQECERILGAPLPHLSMGMSGDFEVAIEEGATLVRIGTALFGDRPPRGQ